MTDNGQGALAGAAAIVTALADAGYSGFSLTVHHIHPCYSLVINRFS